MQGKDDPENERWCDVVGNFYSTEFCRNFSYEDPTKKYHPTVRLHIQSDTRHATRDTRLAKRGSDTFRGRIEAVGLKPNFAYQLKLRGDYRRDPESFETIGYLGRWRLGEGTNYTDDRYEAIEDKSTAESYILFDFFVTDATGAAAKDFALCQSYHVLWQGELASTTNRCYSPPRPFSIQTDAPALYSRPKPPGQGALCAEVQLERYAPNAPNMCLPPGDYTAFLALTEESFHSNEADGGYWATVMKAPARFAVDEGGN
jgi:hypothetical protein